MRNSILTVKRVTTKSAWKKSTKNPSWMNMKKLKLFTFKISILIRSHETPSRPHNPPKSSENGSKFGKIYFSSYILQPMSLNNLGTGNPSLATNLYHFWYLSQLYTQQSLLRVPNPLKYGLKLRKISFFLVIITRRASTVIWG